VPSFASTDGPKSDIPVDGHNRYKIPRYPASGPIDFPTEGSGMLVPWTRVSTILDTHEDKEGIFKWTKRLVVKGLGAREDLYALAAATRLEDKSTLLRVANQAFDYAKGQAASNLGSALHGFLERWVEGDPTLVIPSQWRGDIGAVMAAFQAANIRLRPDLQEMVVVRPDLKDGDAGGLAGRFDLVVEMLNPETGEWELIVADYKTGSDPLAYGSWKIQQQLGLYGTGWAVWDGTHWHPMPAIRRDKILMVHVLPGQASVQIHVGSVDPQVLEDDLAAAYRTRRRRKEAKKAWRPLVTVEDGALTSIGDPSTASAPVQDDVQAELGTSVPIGPLKPTKTPDQVEQERIRDERLARISGEMKPNDDADDELTEDQAIARRNRKLMGPPDDEMIRTEPDQVAAFVQGPEAGLAPLAGPGERGCGVCGRKGHRRGSPKCLGDADPFAKFDAHKVPSVALPEGVQAHPDGGTIEHADGVHPRHGGMPTPEPHPAGGHQWTLDPESQTWVCAIGGEDAAPEVATVQAGLKERDEFRQAYSRYPDNEGSNADRAEVSPLTLEDHARSILSDARDREDDKSLTTGDVAVLSGDEAEIRKWWTPNSDPDDETTEADLAAALLAGEMVRAERAEVDAVAHSDDPDSQPDPFDEDGSTALTPAMTWLEQIQQAPDKATLREIRAAALVVDKWTAELTAAGLERIKVLAQQG
jgi:hypothetical protein